VLQFPLALHAVVTYFGTSLAPDAWLAFGNDATCTAQGFLALFASVSGIPFDMVLSLVYLLIVKYGWNERNLRKLEVYSHALIWPFASGFSTFSAFKYLYGYGLQVCFLLVPEDCIDVEGDCTPTASVVGGVRLTGLAINLSHLVFSVFVMCQVYGFATRGQEEQVARLVAIKGFFYALAVSAAQAPVALWLIVYLTTGYESQGLAIIYMLVLPLAGLLNLLVFMMNHRKMHTKYGTTWRTLIDCVAAACCRCFDNHKEHMEKDMERSNHM